MEFISGSNKISNTGKMLKQVQNDDFTEVAEAKLPPHKKERKINGKPIFKNNLEKYEWLVENEPQNKWIQEFQHSKEYKIYHE